MEPVGNVTDLCHLTPVCDTYLGDSYKPLLEHQTCLEQQTMDLDKPSMNAMSLQAG